MKRLMHSLWLSAMAAMLLLAPAAAPAQELKPVAVFSVAPIDKLLGDVDYLTATAGAADAGRLATLVVGPYIDGVDKTKPSGGYVTLDGETPVFVGFVPTTDLTKILATLRDQVGEPKDVGDGVQQLGDAPVFLKLVDGYTFVSQDARYLTNLPKDPVALLGGMEKNYSIAAKMNVQNLPREMKDRWIEDLKQGFDATPIETDDPAQRELAEKTSRNALNQIIRLVDESNELMFGWAVDPTAKTTYIDFTFTAVPGSPLAKEMAGLKDAKTNFAGFLMEDAAFTMNFSSTLTDKDQIDQQLSMIETLRTTLMKELEKEGADAEEMAAAQDLVGTLFDVLGATVKEGKSDGGAVALAEASSLTFVAGLQVVDTPKLEDAIKRAVAFAQKKHPEELEKVEIKFDASKHGGVRFHTILIPVEDDQAKKVFGDKLEVIVGGADKAVYVALGSKADATLKKVIDQSAANANKAVPPMQMTLAIGPFIKFVDSVEPNPVTAMLVDAADKVKGNDRIMINVKAIPNGEQMRFELEEGVLQIIGEAAKAAQGAAGGGAF